MRYLAQTMKRTFLATLLLATTNSYAIDPATALSVVSIVSSLPGNIERFTGTRSTTGIGEFSFGPDVSENTACKKAEDRAKLDAVRNVLGEDVVAHASRSCKESGCVAETDVWTLSDAHLKESRISNREIVQKHGARICKITLDAKVSSERPFSDLHVDSKFSYKSGEQMNFKVTSTENGKLYIYHVEGNKASMVFPNVYQKNELSKEISIPNSQYTMTVQASKFDESLVFVLIKGEDKFLPQYEFSELNNKLLSIPVKDRKIVRRNLVIEQ